MTDTEIVGYRFAIEADIMAAATIDLRALTEERVRAEVVRHCEREGRKMVGRIMIQWICDAQVRTEPADVPAADSRTPVGPER